MSPLSADSKLIVEGLVGNSWKIWSESLSRHILKHRYLQLSLSVILPDVVLVIKMQINKYTRITSYWDWKVLYYRSYFTCDKMCHS